MDTLAIKLRREKYNVQYDVSGNLNIDNAGEYVVEIVVNEEDPEKVDLKTKICVMITLPLRDRDTIIDTMKRFKPPVIDTTVFLDTTLATLKELDPSYSSSYIFYYDIGYDVIVCTIGGDRDFYVEVSKNTNQCVITPSIGDVIYCNKVNLVDIIIDTFPI